MSLELWACPCGTFSMTVDPKMNRVILLCGVCGGHVQAIPPSPEVAQQQAR